LKQINEIEKILGIKLTDPDIRTGADMQSVMYNQKNCTLNPEMVCYEMYRDRYATEQDHTWLKEHDLRYDITVIFSHILCGEYNKTKGHYHPICLSGMTYPELYEVISGKAIYLLQKTDLSDIVAVYAEAGQAVLIPPDYGHVTINPSASEPLVMVNIVSSRFTSIYGDYENRIGAAYYYLSDQTFVQNRVYPASIPGLRKLGVRHMSTLDGFPKTSIYSIIGNEKVAAFFNDPSTHQNELKYLFFVEE
jgi:glucose-6-phosphate isomerase